MKYTTNNRGRRRTG